MKIINNHTFYFTLKKNLLENNFNLIKKTNITNYYNIDPWVVIQCLRLLAGPNYQEKQLLPCLKAVCNQCSL